VVHFYGNSFFHGPATNPTASKISVSFASLELGEIDAETLYQFVREGTPVMVLSKTTQAQKNRLAMAALGSAPVEFLGQRTKPPSLTARSYILKDLDSNKIILEKNINERLPIASVTKLKEQGLIVCLATNQEKYRMQYLINKFSYDKVFDEIFFSANLGAYKTSLEGLEKIVQTLKEKYGVSDKGEIMYWDDHEENVVDFNAIGFNGQHYKDFSTFKAVLSDYGYHV